MRIKTHELRAAGVKPFQHRYEAGELRLDDERAQITAPLDVSGTASLKGDEVRVKGDIGGQLDVACDRCLQPAVYPVSLSFDAHLIPAATYQATNKFELEEADLDYSVLEGEDEIDLDGMVREQLLLALPVRLLCREDCRGLCADCGINLNEGACQCRAGKIDPRWGALAAFKKSE